MPFDTPIYFIFLLVIVGVYWRLRELNRLCSRQGSRIILWIPPVPGGDPNAELIKRAGSQAWIPVITPSSKELWKREDFLEGYHLTPQAAKRFTVLFAQQLEPLLAVASASPRFEVGDRPAVAHSGSLP